MYNKAFVSYSHTDVEHLARMQIHLAPYIREKKVDVWDDTRIKPGSRWKEEIKQAIALARVAILLVSADFLASEFIAQNELPPLLDAAEQQGMLVLSVILSPCAFEWSKLARYQSLNAPSSPLIKMPRWEQEAIWAKLAKYVTDALQPASADETLLPKEELDEPPKLLVPKKVDTNRETTKNCERCDGTGSITGVSMSNLHEPLVCPTCDGSGKLPIGYHTKLRWHGLSSRVWVVCQSCGNENDYSGYPRPTHCSGCGASFS